MRALVVFLLLWIGPLAATHILFYESLDNGQKKEIFDRVLRGEPPRVFYEAVSIDLKKECERLAPGLRLQWVPPTLWQLGVLHAFFCDGDIQKRILACLGDGWEPLSYDEMLHSELALASSVEKIAECFDRHSKLLPGLCDLFFRLNEAVADLYERAGGSDAEFLRLVLSELPPFNQWAQRAFPFWKCPWIYNPNSAQLFYYALTDEPLLSELLRIERMAHENGEWVLYRGFYGTISTLQNEAACSHALSFGSTLLGGTFFSLEASALTYAKSEAAMANRFLALRVTPQELREFFRIGPLHPFVQMLVDGEMFHAHTKVAASKPDEYGTKPLNGYFMRCNRYCNDPAGYLLTLTMSPEELERAFLSLCERSGHVFLTSPTDLVGFKPVARLPSEEPFFARIAPFSHGSVQSRGMWSLIYGKHSGRICDQGRFLHLGNCKTQTRIGV